MSEPAAVYKGNAPASPLPCPFCGNADPKIFSGHELVAQCPPCGLMAPVKVWNGLAKKDSWHHPRDNTDIKNMPPPDTYVVGHYLHEDGSESDPVILRFTGDVKEIASMYRPITRWCAISEE